MKRREEKKKKINKNKISGRLSRYDRARGSGGRRDGRRVGDDEHTEHHCALSGDLDHDSDREREKEKRVSNR